MSMRVPDYDTDAGPMLGSASLLTVGSFTTLVLSGEFDAGTSSGLTDALRVASAARRDLVVDMTGVTFLDGFALRHIEQASRPLAGPGRRCASRMRRASSYGFSMPPARRVYST